MNGTGDRAEKKTKPPSKPLGGGRRRYYPRGGASKHAKEIGVRNSGKRKKKAQ